MNVSYPLNVGRQTTTVYVDGAPVQGATTPAVIEAIKAQDWEKVVSLLSPVKAIEGSLAAYGDVAVENGVVTYRGRVLNNGSAQRILELVGLGLPIDSEVRCLASLMRHDDPRVIDGFEDFIQRWNIPRTSDGRIVLCKGVRADFRDGHTGRVDWSVGNTVKIGWNEIDRDPNVTCSRGLHAAPLEGARSYASRPGGRLIEVYVWPEHIGSLPYDYKQNGKVRVVEAYVSRELDAETAAKYYDTTPLVVDTGTEDETGAFNSDDALGDADTVDALVASHPRAQNLRDIGFKPVDSDTLSLTVDERDTLETLEADYDVTIWTDGTYYGYTRNENAWGGSLKEWKTAGQAIAFLRSYLQV